MSTVYRILGVMSGTSLDGVDLCLCHFHKDASKVSFQILKCVTVGYENSMLERLRNQDISGRDLSSLDKDLAFFFATQIKIHLLNEEIYFIASHGHTIFHDPSEGYTCQIGNGGVLAKLLGIPVVSDFRTEDVALGGQGAPLVPIGDRDLFAEYKACINLGGFANISFQDNGEVIAYDICAVNFVLNHYALKINKIFDKDGEIARCTIPDQNLIMALNSLPFYEKKYPKSLSAEWANNVVFPLIDDFNLSPEAVIASFTYHVAERLLENMPDGNVLITGGGAKNLFLMDLVNAKRSNNITIPDETIIDYKEAMVFAYLGFLRWTNQQNVLSSVTGASRNSCSGSIHCP